MRELTDALNNKVEENRFGMKLVVVTYMHLGGQSLKETGAGSKGVFQDNQVLSTELIICIGHHKEILESLCSGLFTSIAQLMKSKYLVTYIW